LALNSTPRRRFGVALGVVLAGVTAGLIGFAGVASAHTSDLSASCRGDKTTLTVNLTRYLDGTKKGTENHVKITDNGKVLADTGFQAEYRDKVFVVSGAEKHTFLVDVTAWDSAQYNVHAKRVVEACVTTPPPTKTTTSSQTTQTTTTTTTTTGTTVASTPPSSSTEVVPVVATSTTTPPPAAQGGPLAETGASIALPLGIAGVLIIGGVGALFVVRRRSKA
jgi:LPXTG-motif cell wall-anchored protein